MSWEPTGPDVSVGVDGDRSMEDDRLGFQDDSIDDFGLDCWLGDGGHLHAPHVGTLNTTLCPLRLEQKSATASTMRTRR